jgi:hypothetical protein
MAGRDIGWTHAKDYHGGIYYETKKVHKHSSMVAQGPTDIWQSGETGCYPWKDGEVSPKTRSRENQEPRGGLDIERE